MMLVVPPASPAAVPVKKSSIVTVPMKGSCMCVCGSMPPGIRYWPEPSIVCTPAGASFEARSPSAAIWPSIAEHIGQELPVGVDDGGAADQQSSHRDPPLGLVK